MRALSSDMSSAVAESSINAVLLWEGDFDSGTIGMWTGIGPLTWGDKSFTGVGDLCDVSEYSETQDLEAQGMTYTLSGINASLVSVALNEKFQGRTCRLWLAVASTSRQFLQEGSVDGILLEDGNSILLESRLMDEPYPIFIGLMDKMTLSDDGQTATITMSAENVLSILQRAKTRRYTAEDQKRTYPDDKGLDFIATIQDLKLTWGSSSKNSGA